MTYEIRTRRELRLEMNVAAIRHEHGSLSCVVDNHHILLNSECPVEIFGSLGHLPVFAPTLSSFGIHSTALLSGLIGGMGA
jgi:hypothetical protein